VIIQDFPGPGIFNYKIQDFPGGVGTMYLVTRWWTKSVIIPQWLSVLTHPAMPQSKPVSDQQGAFSDQSSRNEHLHDIVKWNWNYKH